MVSAEGVEGLSETRSTSDLDLIPTKVLLKDAETALRRTLKEVQEALGHQTITVTMRCNHLAPDHLRAAVAVEPGAVSGVSSN